MAARINPSKGGKPDKLIRDALMIALNREHIGDDGKKIRKIQAIAAKLVESAIDGNIAAAKEIGDRVDGRPVTPIDAEPGLQEAFKGIQVRFVKPGQL